MTVLDRIPALKGHGRRRAVDEVALLRQNLATARAHQAEAEEIVVQQQATIDDLVLENHELRAQLVAYRAAAANAHRIDVPPMVRDTSAIEDQATTPIDVRSLHQAAAAGLLGPVTDPGRIR